MIELRTLRVSAEMDAAKYAAGAQQKVAADKAMAASSQQAGAAIQQTDTKISQSGDVLARLSRGYVDGYRNAERFEQGLRQLNRGLDTGKINMAQAEAILIGMNQKLGMSANAAEIASRGQTQLATAVKLANAQLEQQVAVVGRVRAVNDNEASFRRRNLTYQLFDVGQMAALGQAPAMLAMQQGPQILQLYAGQGGIRAALSDSVGLAARLIRTMGPFALVAGAGAAAIASMRDEIEQSTGRAVTFGEVAVAVLKTVASDIYGLVEPAVDAIAPWFEAAWEKVSAGAIVAGNTLINTFTAAFVAIGHVWQQFPNMIGALVTGAANAVIGGVESMLNTLAGYLDPLIEKLNTIFERMSELSGGRFQGHIDPLGTFDFGEIPNTYLDDLRRATDEHNTDIRRIMERDPLGDYYRSVRDRAGAVVRTGGISGEADPWLMGGTDLRKVDQDALRRDREAQRLRDAEFERVEGQVEGFLSTFQETLISSGGDVGKAFGASVLQGLQEAAREQLKMFATEITKMILGYGPSSGGSSILGGLLGGASAVASSGIKAANDNFAAPLGAISRGVGGAVNLASGLLGSSETANTSQINSFLKAGGVDINAAQTAWCAAFVNSSLKQIGVDGSGSLVANSFLGWGNAVDPSKVLAGDVLVRPNGYGIGQTGGHVGFATGATRIGARGLQLEMLSGNTGGAGLGTGGVGLDWVDAAKLDVRRAAQDISKLGGTAAAATEGLGGFAGGLGQLGQALMSVGGGAGGSGWFSGLMGMFGGVSGATNWMNSISPLATSFLAGGGVGLFANGGITDRPAIFGEGPFKEAAVPLPDGRRIPVEMRGGGTGGMHITIGWDRGSNGNIEPVIRETVQKEAPPIANQASAKAVSNYSYRQRQGGAAADDHRYKRLKRMG